MRRSEVGRSGPWWALAAVAAAYGAAQVWFVGVRRFFAWDEAVYYAKASPRLVEYSWVPARALGLPLLIRPVTEFGASAVVVRSWLLGLTALGLFLAFAPWVRVVRWPAVVGAALFASSWLALFYGSSLYPNLPLALAVVGAVGCALVVTEVAPRRWAYAGCGIGFAIGATTRPTDALLELAGFALAMVVARRARGVRVLSVAGGGVALGWLVWAGEAYVRFGGPVARWRAAFGGNRGHALSGFVRSTALVRPTAPLATSSVYTTFLWWAAIVGTAAFGLVAYRGRSFPLVVSIATAAPLVVAYLTRPSFALARFLIPAYASLAIASGAGMFALATMIVRARRLIAVRTVVAVGAVVALAGFANWDLRLARQSTEFYARWGGVAEAAGTLVRAEARGEPCEIAAQANEAAVAVASGCRQWHVDVRDGPRHWANDTHPDADVLQFVVLNRRAPARAALVGWRVRRVHVPKVDVRYVYESRADESDLAEAAAHDRDRDRLHLRGS